jgi:hypothetical protein
MSDKRQLESDRKLIGVLFGIDPLDWCRRDDGTLVIIHPGGKKTVHTPEEIDHLSAAALARRSAAPPAGKKPSAAASRPPAAPASPAAKKAAAAGADEEVSE